MGGWSGGDIRVLIIRERCRECVCVVVFCAKRVFFFDCVIAVKKDKIDSFAVDLGLCLHCTCGFCMLRETMSACVCTDVFWTLVYIASIR